MAIYSNPLQCLFGEGKNNTIQGAAVLKYIPELD